MRKMRIWNRYTYRLDRYTGNVWTHILSLKREDATRLGYDNAKAWMNLLRANRNDIAAAMNIPLNHFHCMLPSMTRASTRMST